MHNRAVLVVDDDPFIRKLVVTTLEDVADHLHEAGTGEEALELAEGLNLDVVFLDIDMPGIDGLETCRRLRARTGTAMTTIVMLTAAGADLERPAREAGADLFLTKPFSPLDLLRLVDELRGRSA